MQRNFRHLASFAVILFLGFSFTYAQTAFITPDLRWAGLKGHVKSVTETYYVGSDHTYIEFRFNKEGKLTYYYSENWDDKAKIARNKSGRIYKIFTDDDVEHFAITYKYNQNGYVLSTDETWFEGGEETQYVLNASGWPTQAKSQRHILYGPVVYLHNYSIIYNYSALDAQGNWTRCEQKSQMISTTNPEVSPSDFHSNLTVIRKITYWQ